jgi:hypothetical protein
MLGKTPHKENSCPRAGFNGRYEVVQEEESALNAEKLKQIP